MGTNEKSIISDFYRDETLFLTGATGFLGKALIYKLLKTCPPKRVYLLVRSKKGKDPQQRVNELFDDPVFANLKLDSEEVMKQWRGVEGDVAAEGLGLSPEWRSTLCQEVTVIIHAAATVRFDEKLRDATHTNVRATKEILALARETTSLKTMTHVSTAYSNCNRSDVDEVFYDPPISADNLITIVNSLDDKQLDHITPSLLQGWPNTYTFTKAVAEQLVKENSNGLPIAVFRPAIITGSLVEPDLGWTDNINGPTGLIVGVGSGVLRVLNYRAEKLADIVPIDMTVNALLTITYETSLTQLPVPKIYNYVSSPQNPINWRNFNKFALEMGMKWPIYQTIYYYAPVNANNRFAYLAAIFFFHLIPGLLIDLILLLTNKKPRMLKIYIKIHKMIGVVEYFCNNEWAFKDNNVQMLLSNMSDEDQKLFNFDIKSVNWREYFSGLILGVRRYIFKESLDNLSLARKKFFRLYLLHRFLQLMSVSIFSWTFWKLYRMF